MSFEDFQNTALPNLSSTQYKVTKHPVTNHKLLDWGLNINRKWIFLGDSNLSRFPTHKIADLQVDCFPDGNYRHIQQVLVKATSHTQVEVIVLCFSLSCRKQRMKVTATGHLRGAVRAAHTIFPGAKVVVPLINLPDSLPPSERTTLIRLNKYVARSFQHIPPLDDSLFETTGDHLWTRDTARAYFTHWVSHLNLQAP